ncbi:MAG: type II toxin-antitoxin system RelE/ParE family toxin [Caulobacter sp.]
MAKVVWSRSALADLDDIASHIARDNLSAAVRISEALWMAGESLADHPNRGRLAASGLRELVTVRPYILRYRVSVKRVLVVQIRHGARRPG